MHEDERHYQEKGQKMPGLTSKIALPERPDLQP